MILAKASRVLRAMGSAILRRPLLAGTLSLGVSPVAGNTGSACHGFAGSPAHKTHGLKMAVARLALPSVCLIAWTLTSGVEVAAAEPIFTARR